MSKVILLVDDDTAQRDHVSGMLTGLGHSVQTAPTGGEALLSAWSAPPDLMLVGVALSDLDGYEVAHQLRGESATRRVPVLLMCSQGDVIDDARAASLGAVDFLIRPLQPEAVAGRIAELLGDGGPAPTVEVAAPEASAGLAAHCAVGLWQLDAEGTTVYANGAMCELLQVDAAGALGVSAAEAIEGGLLRGALGRVLDVHVEEAALEDGVLLTVVPIGAQRAAEAALVTEREARAAQVVRLGHDLRTPLAAIMGYCELLDEELEELPELRGDVARIAQAGNELLGLVELMLAEPQEEEPDDGSFAVRGLIDEALEGSLSKAEARGNRLVRDFRAEEDLGRMWGDRDKLARVLSQLLDNACKFTERGEVAIDCRRTERDGAESVVFVIRDTGIGITPEDLERMRRPMRHEDTFDGSGRRRGMGLIGARLLCRVLGGSLEIDSETGLGTVATVRVPAGVAAAASGG